MLKSFFLLNNSVKNARTYGHKRVALVPHDVTQYNIHTKSNSTNKHKKNHSAQTEAAN